MKLELVFINTFKDHVNSSDASLRQYRADLNLFIDHVLPANKPKQIKWIMTCVSLIGLSEFNTQYFFMGMVRFESQEYTL